MKTATIDCTNATDAGLVDKVECSIGVYRPQYSYCAICKKRSPGKLVEVSAREDPGCENEQLAEIRQLCFGCKACEFWTLTTCEQKKRLKAGHLCIKHLWPEKEVTDHG
mgnify:CR=1 FL=1